MATLDSERQEVVNNAIPYVRWVMYTRMTPAMRRRLVYLLGSPEDLYQILAQEFCRIVTAMNEVRRKEEGYTFPPYVVTEMIAKAIEVANQKRNANLPREPLPDHLSRPGDAPEYEFDERERILWALEQLPQRHRDIVRRRIMEGEQWSTIAADYGVTPQALQSMTKVALAMLRDLYVSRPRSSCDYLSHPA